MSSDTPITAHTATAAQKEEHVYEVFESISEDYDKMNDVISFGMHRFWKRSLIEDLTAHRCDSILDVASGTGDIAIWIARENPQAHIVASDFSGQMLSVAQRRIDEEGLTNIEVSLQNAMEMSFDDDTFDASVVSFGLRNMPSYEQVLREMMRVVKSGGYVYCLDSSFPTNRFIRPFFKLYFKYLMPLMGRLFVDARAEYTWLYDSTEAFLTKRELADLMRAVGLEDISIKSHLFGSAARHRGRKP
ncbi:MAG: demethylmenaquinone methyltransferase [Coriobacteriia bacterium]|nr:demethylmenaquinone methyltransferase [Coriobacteriia bacterium]